LQCTSSFIHFPYTTLFRSYPKSLLNFNKIYKDGKIFFMEENYRSSKNIVSICNKFIQHNTLRYDKNIYTNNSYIEPINIVKVKSDRKSTRLNSSHVSISYA